MIFVAYVKWSLGHGNSVSVQTLLGCFGLGLTLMNTSSCSIREVMQCGSTSMSSLISNISTSGRQPCGKHKEESKKKEMNKVFYTVVNHSYSRTVSVSRTLLASVLKQQSYSYSAVIHQLLLMLKRKTAAGTRGVRLSFTGPWPCFSSPDTANSAGSEETATYAGTVLESRKPAMLICEC